MHLFLPLFLVACQTDPVKTQDDTGAGTDHSTNTTTTTTTDDTGTTQTDDTGTTTTTTTTDTGTACTNKILSFAPVDGTMDVPVDTTVVVGFSEPVTAATIDLTNNGKSVQGTITISPDGYSAILTPDKALDFSTDYMAESEVCGNREMIHFTTAENTVDLTGSTYVLDLSGSDITWTDPSSTVASLLLGLGTVPVLLFGVESYSGGTLDLMGAVGESSGGGYIQYPCTAPIDFAPGSAPGGKFTAGPLDTSIVIGSDILDMYEFTVDGTLKSDGSNMTKVHVTGKVDIGPVLTANGYSCSQLQMFGVSCVDCGNGTTTCINMDFEDSKSPVETGLTLDPSYPDLSQPECK